MITGDQIKDLFLPIISQPMTIENFVLRLLFEVNKEQISNIHLTIFIY